MDLDKLWIQEAESEFPGHESERQHSSQASFMQYKMFFTWLIDFPICPLYFLKKPCMYPSASDKPFSEE